MTHPSGHIRWLCSLVEAPSSAEIQSHLCLSPDQIDSTLGRQLVHVSDLLRTSETVSVRPYELVARLSGDVDLFVRVLLDAASGLILSIDTSEAQPGLPGLSQSEKAAHVYDQVAPRYEELAAGLVYYWEFARSWLLSNVRGSEVVFDIGCGPGQLTRDLPADVRVFGTDISPRMVTAASAQRPAGEYLVHDYHDPLPSAWPRANVLVSLGCLDFAMDLGQVLKNFAASCAAQARLLISVPRPAGGSAPGRTALPPFELAMTTYADTEVRALLGASGLSVAGLHTLDGYSAPGVGLVRYGLWELMRQGSPHDGRSGSPGRGER